MPDLNFQVEGVIPQRHGVEPLLLFRMRITEVVTPRPTPIHSVVLHCQVRIEPALRRYSDLEKGRLLDVFGTPERWGQTLRPMPWAHVTAVMPPFTGSGAIDLPVPCTFDFSLAATRYFGALDGGDIPLCFLFSGTIFYDAENALQVAQVPWQKEAHFRLPATTWLELMDTFYHNCAWLRLRKDVFDRLNDYKSFEGLPTWEHTLERLLAAAEGAVTP
jgi:hypothetical protein